MDKQIIRTTGLREMKNPPLGFVKVYYERTQQYFQVVGKAQELVDYSLFVYCDARGFAEGGYIVIHSPMWEGQRDQEQWPMSWRVRFYTVGGLPSAGVGHEHVTDIFYSGIYKYLSRYRLSYDKCFYSFPPCGVGSLAMQFSYVHDLVAASGGERSVVTVLEPELSL